MKYTTAFVIFFTIGLSMGVIKHGLERSESHREVLIKKIVLPQRKPNQNHKESKTELATDIDSLTKSISMGVALKPLKKDIPRLEVYYNTCGKK